MAIHYQAQLDRTFHALGDGTRRKMLAILSQRSECTASDLGEPFSIAQPSVSKHIRVLETAGLISRQIEGRVHRFRLIAAPLKEAQDWIATHREFWEGPLDSLDKLLKKLGEEKKMIPRSNSKVEIERIFNINAKRLFVVLSDPTFVQQTLFS